jgi:hypothetical protein
LVCSVNDAVNDLPCSTCAYLNGGPIQPALPLQHDAGFLAAPRLRIWWFGGVLAVGLDWFLWLGDECIYRQGDEAGAQDEEAKQAKVAKIDAKIGQRSRMRQMLQAVNGGGV